LWGWLVGGLIFSDLSCDHVVRRAPGGGIDHDAAALTIVGLMLVLISLVWASICIATTVISLRPRGCI